MRIHLLTALLALAAPAAAQDAVLRPGSEQVRGEQIPERNERFELYERNAGGEPVGDLYLATRFGTVDGRQVIGRREMTLVDGDVVQSDSFAVERRTLAPLHARLGGPAQTVWLTFGPAAVHTVIEGDWGTDTTRAELNAPVFAAGATDLLLGALPLADGYAARADVFVWHQDENDTLRIRVEGEESVALPGGGRARTWRVAVRGGATAGTYWMDRESHTLVQYESADGELRVVRSRGPRSRAREAR